MATRMRGSVAFVFVKAHDEWRIALAQATHIKR
jgi:hypothetical protein